MFKKVKLMELKKNGNWKLQRASVLLSLHFVLLTEQKISRRRVTFSVNSLVTAVELPFLFQQ